MRKRPTSYVIAGLVVALVFSNRAWIRSVVGVPTRQGDRTEFSERMKLMHERMDPQVRPGSTIMLGDSITQSFHPSSPPFNDVVNYGVGSNTSLNLMDALPVYKSLPLAKRLILQIGGNDLFKRGPEETIENIRRTIEALPRGPRIWVNGIFPINEARINKNMPRDRKNAEVAQINAALKTLCDGSRCVFIDVSTMADGYGVLKDEYDFGDGLHLSRAGYKKWESLIAAALD